MAEMGRPAIYSKPEDMILAVENYFEWVKGEFKDTVVGEGSEAKTEREWVRLPEPVTVTGLALHLGFESRQSFYDYENKGDFSYIIKNARLRVENAYEKNLYGSTPTGSIFALKNMGWKDKQELDHTSNGETLQPVINIFPATRSGNDGL